MKLADFPIGRGDRPDLAYEDLARRLEGIQPTRKYEPVSDLSGEMWTWELHWPTGQVTTIDRAWRGEGSGPHRRQQD